MLQITLETTYFPNLGLPFNEGFTQREFVIAAKAAHDLLKIERQIVGLI